VNTTRSLEGRHAVVTGGARGIGLAIAQRLLHAGAKVTLWDREAKTLAAAARESASLGTVDTDLVDVTDQATIEAAAQRAHERHGAVTILVNNAGVLGPTLPVWETPVAQWCAVLAINLTGAFLCARALVPAMREAGWGRVINIASVAGKEGNAMNAAYSASKAGMIALTKSLAKELATSGVLVNCIAPSSAETAIFDDIPPEHREALRSMLLARVPLARFVRPDEIAAMAAWIASPECSFSTGAVFDISGGRATY